MINTLGSYSNIAFNNVYVDINRAFGGQPYVIRQFCAFLFEQVKKYRKPNEVYEVSKPTFTALISEFEHSSKGEQVFATILQHIVIYKEEFEMLKKCAFSPDKYKKIEHDDISVIDHLVKYGLIEYDVSTCFIDFAISALKSYICRKELKDPKDMTNDERRRFVQDKVCFCETKLKKYIVNYFTYNGGEPAGIAFIQQYISGNNPRIKINNKAVPRPNPTACHLNDFFDHKKFIVYFSTIKALIADNWSSVGGPISSAGMTLDQFKVYMDSLNAGRTDADHYDPEDNTYPDNWQISDSVIGSFVVAYNAFNNLFETLNV